MYSMVPIYWKIPSYSYTTIETLPQCRNQSVAFRSTQEEKSKLSLRDFLTWLLLNLSLAQPVGLTSLFQFPKLIGQSVSA